MDSSRFDDLTKALATSTSRRKALQRIGGTFAGSVLAAWPFTRALAAGGGKSQCTHFCATVFGADTPGADQCTSDAAHGKGLCYSCSANPSSICCIRNSSGFCTSYSSDLPCSCGANQTCQNGQCVTPCPTTGSNNGGTCTHNSDCCSGNCTNGYCCDAGRVGLVNGSCALPCDLSQNNCTSCGVCGDEFSYQIGVCGHGDFFGGFCYTDGCPAGSYCNVDEEQCQALC